MPSPLFVARGRSLAVPLPTLGGKQIWADLFVHSGYRIQENVVTNHCRLLDPYDGRLAWGSYAHCRLTFTRLRDQREIAPISDHLVLLLHGIFRSKDAFGPMTRALRRAGYEAAALNYPSTRRAIEDHADQVEQVLNNTEGIRRLSLVTHSMGGLIARMVLGRKAAWSERIQVDRLVMIATPNQGAQLADLLAGWGPYRLLAGPAGQQLTTGTVPDLVPLPDCRFGIVAGYRGDGHGYNPMLDGEDDLTVTVESALLEGAEDTLMVPAIHTFIMRKPKVICATLHYLQTGRFTSED